jgi:hypothetical protein
MPLVIRSPKSRRRDSQLGGSSHFETFRNSYESERTRRTRQAGSFKLVEAGLWAVHSGGVGETMFLALATTHQGRPLQQLATMGCERVAGGRIGNTSTGFSGSSGDTVRRNPGATVESRAVVNKSTSYTRRRDRGGLEGRSPNLPLFHPPASQPVQQSRLLHLSVLNPQS